MHEMKGCFYFSRQYAPKSRITNAEATKELKMNRAVP